MVIKNNNLVFTSLDSESFSRDIFSLLPSSLRDYFIFDSKYHFGWIAYDNPKVVGYVLGQKRELDGENIGFVSHLEVSSGYRNLGIGSELIRLFEESAAGCDKFIFAVIENEQSHDAAFKMLRKNHWEEPRIAKFSYRSTIEKFFEFSQWPAKIPRYRYQPYFFSWSELTAEELQQLDEDRGPDSWRDNPFPSPPSAFRERFEPNTSLGVRRGGKVIGWCITGTYGPDTLLYGSFFLQKQHRNTGIAVSMFLESLRRQQEAGISQIVGFVDKDNIAVTRLHERLFPPHILSKNAVFAVEKIVVPKMTPEIKI